MISKTEISTLFIDNRMENQDESDLRQAQLVILRMLKIVDYICNKHGIDYWLDSGTLLGAVRHGGFIPWDDDIDIAMTREDYGRFLQIAEKEVPEDIFVQNFQTTAYAGNTWTQIKDRKSKIVLAGNGDFHSGLYLDIFPMDSYSKNFVKRNFYEKIFKTLYVKVYAINAPFKKPYFNKINLIKNIIRGILKVVFFPVAIFNKDVIYNLNLRHRDKIIKSMSKNPKTNYGYGTDVLNWDKAYDKDIIFPLKKIKFEDSEFLAPNNYDAYLEQLYGSDYIEIPPVHKRIFHNIEIKPIITDEEEEQLNKNF